MSIATRTGDDGTTGLMYSRRVPKHHPRIEACGGVDELNAALGLARAIAPAGGLGATLLDLQHDLVLLMGELATAAEDLPRYVADGFQRISSEQTGKLDRQVAEIEGRLVPPRGWAMPGDSPLAAALDWARVVCRRAERRVSELAQRGELRNPEIMVYLNRLADLLWLLAREATGLRDET